MHAFKLAIPTIEKVLLKVQYFSRVSYDYENVICQKPEQFLNPMSHFVLYCNQQQYRSWPHHMVFHPVLDKIQNSIDKELPLLSLHQLYEEICL